MLWLRKAAACKRWSEGQTVKVTENVAKEAERKYLAKLATLSLCSVDLILVQRQLIGSQVDHLTITMLLSSPPCSYSHICHLEVPSSRKMIQKYTSMGDTPVG